MTVLAKANRTFLPCPFMWSIICTSQSWCGYKHDHYSVYASTCVAWASGIGRQARKNLCVILRGYDRVAVVFLDPSSVLCCLYIPTFLAFNTIAWLRIDRSLRKLRNVEGHNLYAPSN
jgi:hypothetical protein